MREARLDHVGVFVYSPEPGTPAACLPGRVPRELAEERRGRLLTVQQAISWRRNAALVGSELRVLVESRRGRAYLGRGEMDAPEVDGVFRIRPVAGTAIRTGEFARVRVTAAAAYHRDAVPIGDGRPPQRGSPYPGMNQ